MTTTVVWHAPSFPTLEHFTLGDGQLSGNVVGLWKGAPINIDYVINVDEAWRTRNVAVRANVDGQRRELSLSCVDGRWTRDGVELENVRGCVDVDLGFTPATNVLPIRRLPMAIGEKVDVTAAWITLPNLDVSPLSQTYRRTGERSYHYSSKTGFETTIEVDEDGLVADYPPAWRALARRCITIISQ